MIRSTAEPHAVNEPDETGALPLDAAQLAGAGRHPATPFRIALADGREVLFLRALRVLPGRRIVGEARFSGAPALAKLYVGKGSERHWQRELAGIGRLREADIPTPPLLAADACAGGGRAILSAFLENAERLDERLARCADAYAQQATLRPALALVGRLHAAGLEHRDLHFGNLLFDGDTLSLIDGDAVAPLTAGHAAIDNLALFLGQMDARQDASWPGLLAAYTAAGGPACDTAALATAVAAVRARRLADYLKKSTRDCSLFAVQKTARRFVACRREHEEMLRPLLDAPDALLAKGTLLKDGATCTVARIELAGRALVVKRYNLKNAGHALGRLFRPSRAWHSWHEGLRLRFLGLPTPEPLAMIEERIGPLRRRAWLIAEHCAGVGLDRHLDAAAPPPAAEAQALKMLFATLHRERLTHGDMKATNLLWDGQSLQLIDLDGMTQHRTEAAFARAWRRDRARLLRNWPEGSALHAWLAREIPT